MGRPSLGQRRQVNVRLPVDLVTAIDQARGFTSRDSWMEKAARLALRPIATAIEPDLRPHTHRHDYTTPARTEWVNGARIRYYTCDCGEEAQR